MNLTDHIERIVQKSESSKLSTSTIKSLGPNIRPLKDFLSCTDDQALLFSIVFYHTIESGDADLGDMARHFEIPVMRMIKYKSALDQLAKKRLIRQQENSLPLGKANNISYYIHSSIIDGIINKSLSPNFGKITNSLDFLFVIAREMENASDDIGGFDNLKEDFLSLCRENKNITVANKLLHSDMPEYERLILIFITFKLMNGESDISISDACEFLDNDKTFQLRVRRSFMNGNSQLIKRGLIETTPGMFRNESDLNITDKGLHYLLGEEAKQFALQSEKTKNEILPEKIPSVKLFLNKNEKQQMQTIQGIFEKEKFREISERMKDKNMKAGFSVLLFNEADGIFGRRTTKMDSSVSQTLNAMQNIILQEMEDFEGIMMATTNLTDNLDKAFDRRFLYKVKFDIPNLDIRLQIMQEKIPFLPPEAIRQLCEQHKLTGGQMANIAKKCNVFDLLEGRMPDVKEADGMCLAELGLEQKSKLGF